MKLQAAMLSSCKIYTLASSAMVARALDRKEALAESISELKIFYTSCGHCRHPCHPASWISFANPATELSSEKHMPAVTRT